MINNLLICISNSHRLRLISTSCLFRHVHSHNQNFVRINRLQASLHRLFLKNFGSAHCFRGDGEIRTLDPLLARQVLSQLSYTPREITNFFEICYRNSKFLLSFGAERFELPRYSTRQLSLTFFADFQSFSSFGAERSVLPRFLTRQLFTRIYILILIFIKNPAATYSPISSPT